MKTNAATITRIIPMMPGIGNVIDGEVIAENKVKTIFGVFDLNCAKQIGEKLQLLITAGVDRGEEIQLTVEDVLFKQDQFQVKGRGGIIIHMKEAPKVGEVITVKVQLKYLA